MRVGITGHRRARIITKVATGGQSYRLEDSSVYGLLSTNNEGGVTTELVSQRVKGTPGKEWGTGWCQKIADKRRESMNYRYLGKRRERMRKLKHFLPQ